MKSAVFRRSICVFVGLLAACGAAHAAQQRCERLIMAEVVAIEQSIVLNRYGAFNPAGMLFALRRDVVFSGHPDIADGTPVTLENLSQAPGKVKLRSDKRPRPIVLRANEGDCLEVRFHNLLMRAAPDEIGGSPEQYQGRVPAHVADATGVLYNQTDTAPTGRNLVKAESVSNDRPWTRAASFHVNGLDVVPMAARECPVSTAARAWLCGTDGDSAGLNTARVNPATPQPLRRNLEQQGGQVLPGQSAIYRMYAFREGTYFAYSTAATVGGEGDGGQIGAGLFGAVNVQPRNSKWYRSQVTNSDLRAAARAPGAALGHPFANLDYDGARYASGPQRGRPILAMLDGNEIVHTDVNAIVALRGPGPDHNDTTSPNRPCANYVFGNSCGHAYREFTVVMHDEVKAVQAFAELEDETNPLHAIKDGMGINYGVGGMGAMVVARNRRTGPTKDCPECRAEEFFLSSWANGDPALVLKWDGQGKKPVGAMYPDDPSNVHHSYLNDPVRFRNLHAGPKETHVFHLHAHQWVQDSSAPGSTYLDSQTISPGATFSYEIEFGGSGNQNLSPGDSIFHCHLYPHFAQGMWELWRVHDVFEDGSASRKLPDAEVAGGTENPAIVPIPGSVLALQPTAQFKGYPFYIPGEPGHRPPQPPMDMDVANGETVDGGLQRHVLTGWESKGNRTERALTNQHVLEAALKKGSTTTQINARRVYKQNPNALTALAEEWSELGGVKLLDPEGVPSEREAMKFHSGTLQGSGITPALIAAGAHPHPTWEQENRGYISERARRVPGQPAAPATPAIFPVNGREPARGAPYADPCPASAPVRKYSAGVIQTELTVNRHGWFDPQARILALENDIANIIDPGTRDRLPEPLFFRANSGDCIDFKHSNFVPSALALDDFQIYTPTDTIGQHIHLVKFDVTSSDGSGNGWNYEDGTFSPEEVRERIHAYNVAAAKNGNSPLKLKTHPLFQQDCKGNANCLALQKKGLCPKDAEKLPLEVLARDHPFCGAQRTVQRWYANPIFDPKNGKDYTLRTVFTHDHFGPSSHQQHGLYAALVIEPTNSVWLNVDSNTLDWDALCSADIAKRDKERAKVLGGANLGNRFDEQCNTRNAAVTASETRPPLKLRDDGGPTATRANIIAPGCLHGIGDGSPTQSTRGSRKDTNPIDPQNASRDIACADDLKTKDTRREYGLAFADFSVLYNTALEPINPETRDLSALRFGRRQVPINRPAPLAISSEDPGTQLINYRNEPVPLRVVEFPPRPSAELGGFDYSQKSCAPGDVDCTGDMANVFSTAAHAQRDRQIATTDYGARPSPGLAPLLAGTELADKLDATLASVEQWRKNFNCALYPAGTLGDCPIKPGEPWRLPGDPATPLLGAYEGDPLYIRLVQGAQEAQHVFAMTGQKWLREPDNKASGYSNAQPLGISEHFEFDVKLSPFATPLTDSLYLGSSVDQLWDGMWGLLRSYGRERAANGGQSVPVRTPGLARLDGLPGDPVPLPAAPRSGNRSTQVCSLEAAAPGQASAYQQRLKFDISAVRACELTGSCLSPVSPTGNRPPQKGIPYNQRVGMDDPNGIVFVLNNHLPGEPEPRRMNSQSNRWVLDNLRKQVITGKRSIEPLVLRIAAGQCAEVKLRNHLPRVIPEGPDSPSPDSLARYSDNFMSMILDGFNYNQLRMSSSVGLSAPKVASYGPLADGANFGANELERRRILAAEQPSAAASSARRPGRSPTPLGASAPIVRDDSVRPQQGNLVAACGPGDGDDRCQSTGTIWYAGDYQLDPRPSRQGIQRAAAIEFGAIPLSSFGDAIKQTAHGAIGALVVGPQGSRVCKARHPAERAADARTYTSATVCDQGGKPLYRDFVLVLQDAVDAKIKGDIVPNLKGAEEPDDYGIKAVNYRSEPIWARRGGDPSIDFGERNEFDYAGVLSSLKAPKGRCRSGVAPLNQPGRAACDPETPLFTARAGSQVRLRVVHPGGHTRQQAIALSGHDWNPHPFVPGSSALLPTHAAAVRNAWTIQGAYNGIGPLMGADLLIEAGGRWNVNMDYLWRSQASFLFDGGTWGLMRVVKP